MFCTKVERAGMVPGTQGFPSSSNAATVSEDTPIRIVGSRSGANSEEWREGRGAPVFRADSYFAGLTAPTLNWRAGMPARPNSEKSSAPITGSPSRTFDAPRVLARADEIRRVRAGSLYIALVRTVI